MSSTNLYDSLQEKRHDFLTISGLERTQLDAIFDRALSIKNTPTSNIQRTLDGKIIALLFFQPSTRTRFSFETAALRIGAQTIGFDTPEGTRAGSQWYESLSDMARVMSGYVDAVVMRHPEVDALQSYANYSAVPVINAGNGSGDGSEHPTQALLDLFTIREEFGTLEGLKILLVGAMTVRTVPSFMKAIRHYPSTEIFLNPASPDEISPYHSKQYDALGVNYSIISRPDEILKDIDIIYHHGIRESRDTPIEKSVIFDQQRLSSLPPHAIVLHSLPRADELSSDVDAIPQARYFRQAHNGLPIRMAVLERVLGS